MKLTYLIVDIEVFLYTTASTLRMLESCANVRGRGGGRGALFKNIVSLPCFLSLSSLQLIMRACVIMVIFVLLMGGIQQKVEWNSVSTIDGELYVMISLEMLMLVSFAVSLDFLQIVSNTHTHTHTHTQYHCIY